MAAVRVPLYRSENTGTIPAGADEMLFQLRYNMSQTGSSRLIPGANDATLVSSYPIAIYSYSVQVVGDFYGSLYQTYGLYVNEPALSNYDLGNDAFVRGLKQVKMIAGTSTTLSRATITYRAKKNPKSKWATHGKWKRPPIFLGPDAGDLFNISVFNASASTNRTVNSLLEIHSWKQFT